MASQKEAAETETTTKVDTVAKEVTEKGLTASVTSVAKRATKRKTALKRKRMQARDLMVGDPPWAKRQTAA